MKRILLILGVIFTSTVFAADKLVLTETNTVFLNDSVNGQSVTRLMSEIETLNLLEDKSPIYLVLNTPGGSVFDGIEFIRFAKASKREIHTVTMQAASMGFQIVEALPGKRFVTEYSVLMSHRAAGGFQGQINKGEVESRLNFIKSVIQEMDEAVAKRSGKYTTEQYQDLIKDEYYGLPSRSIADGFADSQVDLQCDSSLSGTKFVTYYTIFGPIVAEFAKCPLNPNVISARFENKNDKNKEKNELDILKEIRDVRLINNI
jgi:ATP-dependent Clp protease protease subunit